MDTRERLRQEIEATQVAYHCLLDSIPEEALSRPSDNPAWNIRQVLYHIAIIPRFAIIEVVMIRKQVKIYMLLPRLIPKDLFDWLNAHMTRLGARGMTRRRLAKTYDKPCSAVLRALDSVPDADFNKHLFYPLWAPLLAGEVRLEYVFGYVKRHFDSHAAQVEKALEEKGQ